MVRVDKLIRMITPFSPSPRCCFIFDPTSSYNFYSWCVSSAPDKASVSVKTSFSSVVHLPASSSTRQRASSQADSQTARVSKRRTGQKVKASARSTLTCQFFLSLSPIHTKTLPFLFRLRTPLQHRTCQEWKSECVRAVCLRRLVCMYVIQPTNYQALSWRLVRNPKMYCFKNLKKSMRVLLRYFQGNGDRPTYKHISVPARILRGLNKNKLITNVEIHLIFMFTLVYVVCT